LYLFRALEQRVGEKSAKPTAKHLASNPEQVLFVEFEDLRVLLQQLPSTVEPLQKHRTEVVASAVARSHFVTKRNPLTFNQNLKPHQSAQKRVAQQHSKRRKLWSSIPAITKNKKQKR
jgi:hypothetical protein